MRGLAYHVTNRRKLPAILAEGLRRDADGWDAGFVWVVTDLGAAIETARGRWGGGPGENVILGVDVRGLDLQPDPHPGFADWRKRVSFAYAGSIAPERVGPALAIARMVLRS